MSVFEIPDVPINDDGRATLSHTHGYRLGNGEVTLCGLYINYATFKGTAPGAPTCPDCEYLDV